MAIHLHPVVYSGHRGPGVLQGVGETVNSGNSDGGHGYFLRFLAVLAAALKAPAVGAPFVPGLRMDSPEPAAMRLRLAAMLLYKPRLAITFSYPPFSWYLCSWRA